MCCACRVSAAVVEAGRSLGAPHCALFCPEMYDDDDDEYHSGGHCQAAGYMVKTRTKYRLCNLFVFDGCWCPKKYVYSAANKTMLIFIRINVDTS